MHIPDGFLSPRVLAPTWGISAAAVGVSLRLAARRLNERAVPLMGVMAAFIFAAQMLNFPVGGGTSGHLMGGVLAAVFLGPFAGALVLTTVLIVQCLVFQDGGLLSLGANIFNMAVVGSMCSYYIYRVCSALLRGRMAAVAVASWLSVLLAASCCAVELALSGTVPLRLALTAMAGVHAVIGIGEAVITCLIVSFVLKVRPDLLAQK